MNPYVVSVEGVDYDVDAPDEQTAWAWANQFHSQNKNKPKTSLWEDVKIAGAGALSSMDQAFTQANQGLLETFGIDQSPEAIDRRFNTAKQLEESRNQWANPEQRHQGLGGAVLGTVATLPAQIPAQVGSGPERMRRMIDAGESVEAAATAGLIDTALTAGSIAAPAAVGRNLTQKITTGAAMNPAFGAASDVATQSVAKTDEIKKMYDPLDPKRRGVEAVIGAGLGTMAPTTGKKAPPSKSIEALDAIAAKKKATPEEPTTTPESILDYKQQDLAIEPPDVDASGIRNPYDLGGQISDTAAGLDTMLNSPQGDLFAQGLRESAQNRPEVIAAKEAFNNEALDLESRIRAAMFILDNYKIYRGPTYKEAKRMLPELIEAHQANRNEYAEGNRLLSEEKPRDAYGRPLYDQPDPLVQPGGEQAGFPFETRGPNLSEVPTEGATGADPTMPIRKPFVPKGQRGAIDPAVFKEGFKRFNRALSNLTDRLAATGHYPPSEYHTNPDGTPMVMLHGTTKTGITKLRPSEEGIHLGYAVPSHIIREGVDHAMYPRQAGRNLEPHEANRNIHPIVIKKGNYPYLDTDIGVWSPDNFMYGLHNFNYKGESLDPISFLKAVAADNGKNLTDSRIYALLNQIRSPDGLTKKIAAFSQLLKEAGINGFFYRNKHESLVPKIKYQNRDTRKRLYSSEPVSNQEIMSGERSTAQHPISFVTWDANNLESVFEKPRPQSGVSAGFIASQKKQSGMWKPFSEGKLKPLKNRTPSKAEEMSTEVERTAKMLEDDTDGRQSVLTKVGAKEVDLIENNAPPSPELMEKILAEPDVGSGRNFVSGALSKALLNDSTGVMTVYRWFANATKRAERFDRDYVRPVADAVKIYMGKPEKLEVLNHVFKKELEVGQRFSAEELQAAGLDDRMINAYAGIRRMFDAALEMQNKARAEAGLGQIKDLEAYVASRWNGPWRATVLDKDGNVVWQVSEKNKWAANKAVEWLKANVDPELKIGEIKYNDSYGRRNTDLNAGYVEMVNLLGTDHPITTRIKELLESTAAFTTENVVGQEKHFKLKSGVRGFAGDRPWAKNDAKDWIKEQLMYAKNAATWAEQQSALRYTKEILADPNVVANKPNLALYLKDYMNQQRGFATAKVFDLAEHSIAKALRISPAYLDEILGTSKSIFYITKLGFFNLPFTAAQLIQPIFTAPYHATLSGQGYSHNAAKSTIEGVSNATGFTIAHLLRFAGRDAEAKVVFDRMPDIFRDASMYAEQNGVIDVNQFSDIRDLERPRALQVAEQWAGANIKMSEQLARTTAFMTFVSHLDQSGKFANTREGRMELFQKAEEATRFTMVDYAPSERALAFAKAGLTGNALSTLQTFKLNQLNQMVKYIDDLRNGNPAPALMFFGLYFLLGGLTGFVGVEDADALYEMFKSILSDDQIAALPKGVREFGVKKAIMEMDELVSMGPVSALTGLNLYSRFDSSNILPLENTFGDSLGSLFPFAKDQIAQVGGLKNLLSSDPNKRLAGGYAITPSAAKGIYENVVPGFTTPEGTVGRGTNPAEGEYTRTPEERSLRNYGFRSTKEAKTKELDFRNRKIQKDFEARRANIAEKVGNQILYGSLENLNDSIQAYIKLGGDPESLITDAKIEKKFINKNTNRLQKLQMAAQSGSYPAINDLLRYMESLGVQ